MNQFSLSENEYNRLGSVLGQLSLINSLLITNNSKQPCEIVATDLQEFISAQENTIRDIIRAMDARYEAQREEGQLNWLHWTYALKIASGDSIHTPNGAEQSVLEGLVKAARIDEDMGSVIALWIEILDKQRTVPAPTAPAKKPAPRKRDKLAKTEDFKISPEKLAQIEKLAGKSLEVV